MTLPLRDHGAKTDEILAIKWFMVVTRRRDILRPYAPHNAIIESANRYYLATLAT